MKRAPNPMPGPSEIEIRPLFELADIEQFLLPEVVKRRTERDAALSATRGD